MGAAPRIYDGFHLAIRDSDRYLPALEEAHETMCNTIERNRNATEGPKDLRGKLYGNIITILHKRLV